MRLSHLLLASVFTMATAGVAIADPSGTQAAGAAPATKSQSAPVQAAPTTPVAPVHGTRAEAVAMVSRVELSFKKYGVVKTFKAIDDLSNKTFHEGDLYPFVYTLKGICTAHGAVPALVGKNLISLKDPDGKYVIKDSIRTALHGGGWYNYKWPNPKTHMIDNKASFIKKLGTLYFVGVGVYRKSK